MKDIRIFWLVVLAASVACTERIDIRTGSIPSQVVIYGHLTTDVALHSIRVTRSADYFSTAPPEGISGAEVTISSDSVTLHLSEDSIPGLYLTKPVAGQMGDSYTLDVVLPDGEHYQATSYLPPANFIDSIVMQPSPTFKRAIELLLYAQDPPEENYYSMFVSINDSILNPKISQFFVMDDAFFNGTYMNGISCYYFGVRDENDKPRFKIGDKITLNLNAVTHEYVDFINQAQSEIRGSNPIFGGPPANVVTNIRCLTPGAPEPLGFFTAYTSRYASTFVVEDYSYLLEE